MNKLATKSQHWHSWWSGVGFEPGHLLCQCWPRSLTPGHMFWDNDWPTDEKLVLAQLTAWSWFRVSPSAVPMLTQILNSMLEHHAPMDFQSSGDASELNLASIPVVSPLRTGCFLIKRFWFCLNKQMVNMPMVNGCVLWWASWSEGTLTCYLTTPA